MCARLPVCVCFAGKPGNETRSGWGFKRICEMNAALITEWQLAPAAGHQSLSSASLPSVRLSVGSEVSIVSWVSRSLNRLSHFWFEPADAPDAPLPIRIDSSRTEFSDFSVSEPHPRKGAGFLIAQPASSRLLWPHGLHTYMPVRERTCLDPRSGR